MTTAFSSVGGFWRHYVRSYESKSYPDFFVRFPCNESFRITAKRIRAISERRSTNRISNYIPFEEINRVRKRLGRSELSKTIFIRSDHVGSRKSRKIDVTERETFSEASRIRPKSARDVSIRFGVSKPGHGYGKERGDFCLVSAVLVGRKITFFYRSIELIGGIAFDLVLIAELEKLLEIEFTEVNLWAKKAFVFALKGNSNQKLYPKLREIMRNA